LASVAGTNEASLANSGEGSAANDPEPSLGNDTKSSLGNAGSVSLHFVAGTLELRGVASSPEMDALVPECRYDDRTRCYRAPALAYAPIVLGLRERGVPHEDHARAYSTLGSGLRVKREPHPYQVAAIRELRKSGGRGIVVLPTGAGKSHVALLAIDHYRRSTLVLAPTLELVRQWYELLRQSFGMQVGVVGGGDYSIEALTVTTYDSAYLHMEHLGARFGMVVFDECHHLPADAYSLAAEQCLAPYRLGLSATPERADGREERLVRLIGPEVYREEINELSGTYLSEYETERITLSLSSQEQEEYQAERAIYTRFLREQGIRMSQTSGWSDFVMRASRTPAGRRAFEAYRRQRELSLCSVAKLDCLGELLHTHRADLSLIFTQDNATAYAVARRFLVPIITHQTKVTERSEILDRFRSGQYSAVVTSKVLNEGVDVPEANVAIVFSGSGSVREHVQRLGRILRKREGKHAILYELISAGTAETHVSERRREHSAYREDKPC
jgi:superfamily II DNA or RNA helicase